MGSARIAFFSCTIGRYEKFVSISQESFLYFGDDQSPALAERRNSSTPARSSKGGGFRGLIASASLKLRGESTVSLIPVRISRFRGLIASASLKHPRKSGSFMGSASPRFRGLIASASLKPAPQGERGEAMQAGHGFRGLIASASLKQHTWDSFPDQPPRPKIPRLDCLGLIEACTRRALESDSCLPHADSEA